MFLLSRNALRIACGTVGRHLSRLPSGQLLGRGIATSDVANAQQTTTVPVRSLGELVVTQERGAPAVTVELATSWRDDCAYSPAQVDASRGVFLDVDEIGQRLHLRFEALSATTGAMKGKCEDPWVVRLELPEKLNVSVNLMEGNIRCVENKLEGPTSIHLATQRGDVTVKQVRSEEVTLSAPSGKLQVTKVSEANRLKLNAAFIHAKRLGASELCDVRADGGGAAVVNQQSSSVQSNSNSSSPTKVQIDSLYALRASISCIPPPQWAHHKSNNTTESKKEPALVVVDALHGHLEVRIDGNENDKNSNNRKNDATDASSETAPPPPLALVVERISGSLSAQVRNCVGGVRAHFDQPEGVSRISTSNGPVHAVVNHQAACRVLLTSLRGHAVTVKAGSCLAPDGSAGKRLLTSSSEDSVWQPQHRTGPVGLVAQVSGTLLPDVSRSELLGTGGKVDVAAARQFASSTSFFGQQQGDSNDHDNNYSSISDEEEGEGNKETDEAKLSEIRVAANGPVWLESLSWRDSIKRQFGLGP